MISSTMTRTRVCFAYLLIAWSGLFTAVAGGEEVTFTFDGQVLNVDDSGGTIGGAINPGDSISGSFTIESATADTEAESTTLGKYDFAILNWDMDIASSHFSLSGFSSIVVQNGAPDRYEIVARLIAPFGDRIWNTFWTFTDPVGDLFSSDALPVIAPDVLPLQTAMSVQFFDEAPALVGVQLDHFQSDGMAIVVGDMDGDGDVDFDDIDDFVLGLTNAAGYEAIFGVPPSLRGDTDGNGELDFDDISGFVGLLSNRGSTAARALGADVHTVPEPATLFLAMLACCLFGTRLLGRWGTR